MRPRRHGRLDVFYTTLLILASWTATAFAGQANVSVDDTYGDTNTGATITYTPASSWNVGQKCSACTANPDPNGATYGSWHDATYYPVNSTTGANKGSLISASYNFNGSAVYVYCITTTSSDSPDGNTDLTFFVDGASVGKFEQTPTGVNVYSYNVLVYYNESLTQGQHEIEIVSGYNDTKALFILDRIMYTTESEDVTTTIVPTTSTYGLPTILSTPSVSQAAIQTQTTSKSSSHTGTIAGAVVGSLAGVALIAGSFFFFLWRRKRDVRKAEEEAEKAVQPFLTDAGTSGPPTGASLFTDTSSALGPPVRSRFSPDSSHGSGGYPAWVHRLPRRHRTHDPQYSFTDMNHSHTRNASWIRDLHSLNLPAPAPPYTPHSTEKRSRPRIATSSQDQSSHSNRTTTQKLPISPLYSPVPGLSPEATTPADLLPGASRSNKKGRTNSHRFNLPTLRIANRSSPHSTSSPFLYTNAQRPQPSARNPAGKDLGTYAGTCALGPSSPSQAPADPQAQAGLSTVAENMSVSGSTVVEGERNAANLEEHQHRWRRKGDVMRNPSPPNAEGLVGGTERYITKEGVQPLDTLRRPSIDEEGSTMVSASRSTPRIHGRPLPHTETPSIRVEKEAYILPTQTRSGPSGHRPLPSRPLPKPRGQPIVPSLGMLPFEKKGGLSS